MKMIKLPFLLAVAGLMPLAALAADARVVPADPLQFERVHLRLTVDDCQFRRESVSVEQSQEKTLIVRHRPVQCFAPGTPEIVDIQLGAFPAGLYEVAYYEGDSREAALRVKFQVSTPASVAVFPALPHPVADYTGLWGKEDEPGWGLSLHQGASHSMFGALFVYGPQREPQWYSVQAGSWESPDRWNGLVVKSDGPPWVTAVYPGSGANHREVGTASLDFHMAPGDEGFAGLTYTIDGQTVTKKIARMRF